MLLSLSTTFIHTDGVTPPLTRHEPYSPSPRAPPPSSDLIFPPLPFCLGPFVGRASFYSLSPIPSFNPLPASLSLFCSGPSRFIVRGASPETPSLPRTIDVCSTGSNSPHCSVRLFVPGLLFSGTRCPLLFGLLPPDIFARGWNLLLCRVNLFQLSFRVPARVKGQSPFVSFFLLSLPCGRPASNWVFFSFPPSPSSRFSRFPFSPCAFSFPAGFPCLLTAYLPSSDPCPCRSAVRYSFSSRALARYLDLILPEALSSEGGLPVNCFSPVFYAVSFFLDYL